jgi:creatinine amidohydrolase
MEPNYYEHSLAEISWRSVEAALKQTDLVIMPLGCVEAYGNLPMGADGIAAEGLATAVAREMKALRTPIIPVGFTPTLAAFPGTLSVRRDALEAILTDMALDLIHFGAKRIFVVNGHAGNNDFVNAFLQKLPERGAKGAAVAVWSLAEAHDEGLFKNYNPHGHASEANASLLLHLRPELVDTSKKMVHKAKPSAYPDIIVPINALERMPDGMHGDTSEASAEKGQILFDRMVKRVCEFLTNWQ